MRDVRAAGLCIDVKIDDTSYPASDARRADGLTIGCEVQFIDGRWQFVRVFHAVDVSGVNRLGDGEAGLDVLERDLDVAKAKCEAIATMWSEELLADRCQELQRRVEELEQQLGLPEEGRCAMK